MQVREAVIPNQTEPVVHPIQGWKKLEKDLMVLSFHISPCACLNAIKCPLVAAYITVLLYLEVKAFTFLCASYVMLSCVLSSKRKRKEGDLSFVCHSVMF